MIDHSPDIKMRIIILHYIVPLIIYFVSFFAFSFKETIMNVIFAVLLAFVFSIILLMSKKKYLSSLSFNTGSLEIKYYTVFLNQKSSNLPLQLIQNLETKKPNVLAQYPCSLKIKYNERWLEYPILTQKLNEDVKEKLKIANH